MRYVATYLLAVMGGNTNPSVEDLKTILASVGVDVDEERMQLVVDNLKGKNVQEVLAKGMELMASVPSGGPVPAASTDAAPAEEAKEEEKKVESESESDDDMGFDLFG